MNNNEMFSCVSSGHIVKDRQSVESSAHLATIWAACTFCCHVLKLPDFPFVKDLYLQQTSDGRPMMRNRKQI